MSARLVAEVLDYAPPDLTDAELVVLLVIAEGADEKTRTYSPGIDVLTHRTRKDERTLRRIFTQLDARGYQVRVLTGTDKKGRPVVANRGHRTRYQLPDFRPLKADT